MRSIIAAIGLMVLAGCVAVQRTAGTRRAAVTAATCDSAVSISGERARLVAVARTLADLSNSAGRNAYSTAQTRIATPTPSTGAPGSATANLTASMIANANNARVELWSAEARQDLSQYQVVTRQIAALDAAARTLPTTNSCRAAGFASATEPTR